MSHVEGTGGAGRAPANMQNVQDAGRNAPPPAAVGGEAFAGGANGAPPPGLKISSFEFMGTGTEFDGVSFSNEDPMGLARANTQRGADAVPAAGLKISSFEGSTRNTDAASGPDATAIDADDGAPALPPRTPPNRGPVVIRNAAPPASATLEEMTIPPTSGTQRESISSLLAQDPSYDTFEDDFSEVSVRRDSSDTLDGADRRGVQYQANDPRLDGLREVLDRQNPRPTSTDTLDTVATTDTTDTHRMAPAPAAAGRDSEAYDNVQDYLAGDLREVNSDYQLQDQEWLDDLNENGRKEEAQRLKGKFEQSTGSSAWSNVKSFFSGIGSFFSGLFGGKKGDGVQ